MLALLEAPEQTVALLRERVKPAVGKEPDPNEVARHVRALDDEDFGVREKASEALAGMGSSVRLALVRALAEQPSAEKKQRLGNLLNKLKKESSPALLRSLRVVEILERLGTPPARILLQALAAGRPGDELTGAAQAALQRLTP